MMVDTTIQSDVGVGLALPWMMVDTTTQSDVGVGLALPWMMVGTTFMRRQDAR